MGADERQHVIRALVAHYIDHYLFDSALFYSERLYYECQSPANLHSLAQCYLRMNKMKQAYLILHDHVAALHAPRDFCTKENRYLFALTCIALDKLDEAEKSLQPNSYKSSDKISLEKALETPGQASGVYLLGRICRRQNRKEMAAHYFKLCVEMDPYMWGAIAELNEIGCENIGDIRDLLGSSRETLQAELPETAFASVASGRELRSHKHTDLRTAAHSTGRFRGLDVIESLSSGGNVLNTSSNKTGSTSVNTSAVDQSEGSVSVSATLGLSSASHHIPFASPGTMPSPSPSQPLRRMEGTMASVTNSGLHSGVRGVGDSGFQSQYISHINQQHSGISGHSDDISGIRNNSFELSMALEMSTGTDTINSNINGSSRHGGSDPRAQLFGGVTPGPGVTPSIQSGTASAMLSTGPQGSGQLTTFRGPPSLSSAASSTRSNFIMGNPLFGDGDVVSAVRHYGDAWASGPSNSSDAVANIRTAAATSDAPVSAAGGAGGVRRVSFGPTARLSFSGAFDGTAQATTAATASGPLGPPTPFKAAVVVDGASKANNSGVEAVGGSGFDGSLTAVSLSSCSGAAPVSTVDESSNSDGSGRDSDEHPYKLQRMSSNGSVMNGSADSSVGDAAAVHAIAASPSSRIKRPAHAVSAATVPTTAASRKSLSPFPMDSFSPIPVTSVANKSSLASSVRPTVPGTVPALSQQSGSYAATDQNLPPSNDSFVGATDKLDGRYSDVNYGGILKVPMGADSCAGQKGVSESSTNDYRGSDLRDNEANNVPAAEGTDVHPMKHAKVEVSAILGVFARAHQLLCLYQCRDCILTLQGSLPEHHFRSGLASQLVGKAYYEMNEYKPAMLAFREMMRVEPFRIHGLETLSTALWHLKRDKELCALAQQAVEVDRMAPETWCIVGNCFSLQKEPDTAIKFFQRALQIDPTFTYAHTLSGHEQVSNEDMDKAVESFRKAILHNDRHYNAWYGLGSIYYRQERYELAEYHFRRALSINPSSSVLHCYLGMALHAQNSMQKTAEALDLLAVACSRDSENPQLHFQRAHILVACDRLQEALEELQLVEDRAPKEPPVHALLGQVHHRRGEVQEALRHLNIAIDLDPKEAASLKAIMDNIDDPVM